MYIEICTTYIYIQINTINLYNIYILQIHGESGGNQT